ncbi:hypothetical protein TUM4261_42170 [Shewanella sp. c952]|nr:hypothetical protein TUM4261_42170 [Shewanella sp. c952]
MQNNRAGNLSQPKLILTCESQLKSLALMHKPKINPIATRMQPLVDTMSVAVGSVQLSDLISLGLNNRPRNESNDFSRQDNQIKKTVRLVAGGIS